MKLTKYGHACVVLEEQGKKLVIDPGSLTPEFGPTDNIVAVVVTHSHADHFNPEHLQAIFKANPEAKLFTTGEVANDFKQPNVTVVSAGQTEKVGPFDLRFGGEMHAEIHGSLPRPQNTTVFVNDKFYYPGDSYTVPDKPVEVLAITANAPWMKIGDSMDYLARVKPKRCFPTHIGLLSDAGLAGYSFGLSKACEDNGVAFEPLQPGQSIEL